MSASGSRISAVTKDLWVQWQQAREYWRDAKSEEFEKTYLQDLMATAEKTVNVIEQLDKLVGKIRKDCE
jgi:thymidylate synthase